jgi:Cft2 family RNA processing exonuclease
MNALGYKMYHAMAHSSGGKVVFEFFASGLGFRIEKLFKIRRMRDVVCTYHNRIYTFLHDWV